MSRIQDSALIDWTAPNNGGGGTSGGRTQQRRLTVDELQAKIRYPTYKKKQERMEPLRTDIGRRALEIFHNQKRAFGVSASRLKMAQRTPSAAHHHNSSAVAAAATTATAANYPPSSSKAAAAAAAAAQRQPQHVPIAVLPTLTASQLDEELTLYLESIATGGAGDLRYNEGETFLGAAVILHLKERFADALEYYSKCVAVDPLLTECYLHRAQCFSKLERPAEALEEYKKYLQMEPATKALLADGGKCALDADRLDEAEQLFLACLSIGAASTAEMAATTMVTAEGTIVAAGAASVAALLLRNRQQQSQRAARAATTLRSTKLGGSSSSSVLNASATPPASPPASSSAAEEWNITDEMPMAAEDQTHDSYAFYNLGEVEERRGNAARATKYYAKVHPAFATPYFEQGQSEFAKENYPMALRLFEAVAKVLPDEVSVHLWLADTYTALGVNEFSLCVLSCLTRAIALPEKVSTVPPEVAAELLAADPDSKHLETTLLRRGMLYLNVMNDLENALKDFSMCLAYNGHNADALLSRARTYLLRNYVGDEELAVADYELVVTLAGVPQSEKAHPYEILGLFYEKKRRFVDAGRFLALAICAGAQPPARSAYRCLTHAVAQSSPSSNNGEELPLRAYDARGWISKSDGSEDPKKKGTAGGGAGGSPTMSAMTAAGGLLLGEPRSAAVMPLSYACVDTYYNELRAREPTVHRRDECSAIERWQPVRQATDKRKEEAEAAKSNKKKKR